MNNLINQMQQDAGATAPNSMGKIGAVANDIADTDGTLMLTPDDIPNYARTSSTGVGQWIIRYSEGVNIPQGDDPVTYQTFNTTISVSLVTPSTNNPSETATLIISKSEEDD